METDERRETGRRIEAEGVEKAGVESGGGKGMERREEGEGLAPAEIRAC